jgi:xanthosine utilization system XapX-like protein
MPIVNPAAPRHTLEDRGDSLAIIIPARRQWFAIIFLCVWLMVWAFGGLVVGGGLLVGLFQLLGGDLKMPVPPVQGAGVGLVVLVWFVGWTIGGAFALYTLLWQLAGREFIQVSEQSIRIQPQVFGLGRSKVYRAENIRGLRVGPAPYDPYRRPNLFGPFSASQGWLAFDYGARTVRCGIGVDEAEAMQISWEIQRRFFQYQCVASSIESE